MPLGPVSGGIGRLAQLGERYVYTVEVAGSSPASPTDDATHCETMLVFAVFDASHFSFAGSCDALLATILAHWPLTAFAK